MALLGNFRSQMLWENIRKGDLSAVIGLLENGTINLEERDDSGQTFLMLACQRGEISLVRELLEAGIDPNAIDNDNWSALLYAAKDGYLEICIELLERDAEIDHRDLCKWTALMWASYKGRHEVVLELLERGADPNVKAEHNMSCLGWAAGRGHPDIITALLNKGAKVNSTDKYGTSPLIWACRKGHVDIVQELLTNGANVDSTGMDSLTAVLVATKGGYNEVVQALLEYDPNINAVDKDGFTALTIAVKEGYEDIVQELLAKDAYVNIADRAGDTILIHAVKGGYSSVVRALLNRYADVDVEGSDGRTALYWAVEKGHADIVQLLIDNDADPEVPTKDGDTALMRAVRNRHELVVRQLLDKGSKVAVYDKKGDTALHISLRARSKRITELLLRNPRNSRLLYRPNKSGETPYSIDAYHQKGILTQIHGHRQLNASDGENLLGYEIYSSSLADILSEPSLNTPITVGLYAKWGSGKSFLIGKLKNEMKSFTKANDDNQITFTWSLFIFLLITNCVIGSVLAPTVSYQVGLGVGVGLFVWEYGFLGLVWVCSVRYHVRFARRVSQDIGKRLQILTLLLQILFCNPVNRSSSTSTDVPLVKFLFSESTKLTSVGGEKALAAMVAGLSESVEKEFGVVSARLYGVVKRVTDKNYISRFKTLCCIPLFALVVFILLCFITGIALFVTYHLENEVANGIMIAFAGIVGLSLLSNVRNFFKGFMSLIIPQRRRIMKAADSIHRLKIDGFMQILKNEVSLMNSLVRAVDRFTKNTTRLVVVVDGMDTCEQEKVLQVLDIIHSLFNEDNSSFVVILAVDPQIIIKGIDQNLKSMFHDTNVNGFDYLRNIVHLPFYLQSQGLQAKKLELTKSVSNYDVNHESPTHNHKYRHQDSTVSQISGFTVHEHNNTRKSSKPHNKDSVAQLGHSNFDISHTLTKNDYFSDINPKSMRRLMNIVAVTGRLLRAYNIDFNWYRLAAWVNLVEQWPYRLSWIILYFEEHDDLNDDVTLKFIYEKIENQMPASSDIEPLLEIDRNVRKLQAFLLSKSSSSPMLNISDLKKFLPCTINLDPYLRKLIRNLQQQIQQTEMPIGLFTPPQSTPASSTQDNLDQVRYMRPNLSRTSANKLPMGQGMYPPGMMPYGPMMYPGMMGMSPSQYMQPGLAGYQGGPSMMDMQGSKKRTNPEKCITEYKGEILSKMSTEEISQLLERIGGLNATMLPQYRQAVLDNNINGLVLANCNLDELGKCLEMKFGDWQLFRSTIQALRDAEEQLGSTDSSSEAINGSSNQAPPRNSSDGSTGSATRSIKFSESGGILKSSVSDEDVGLPPAMRQKSVFKRQCSVDTQRDGVAGTSNFDAIKEESSDEVCRSPVKSASGMSRNDSIVAQVNYESGLLHDFVHTFTEDVSEDDEDSDESEASKELINMNNASPSVEGNGSNAIRGRQRPPVQFSLSLSQSKEADDSFPESETEPLIQTGKEKDTEKTTILTSPTPVLKMPVLKQYDVFGSQHSNTKSEPDLRNTQHTEVNVHSHEDQTPLLTIPKVASTASGGFTEEPNSPTSFMSMHGTRSPWPESQSTNDSLEMLLMVDETTQGGDSAKPRLLSLEESIAQFTHSPDDSSAGDVNQALGARAVSPAHFIQVKGTEKDSKNPESFV